MSFSSSFQRFFQEEDFVDSFQSFKKLLKTFIFRSTHEIWLTDQFQYTQTHDFPISPQA